MKYRMFGKDEELIVYWTDTIYIPKFEQGMVVLWEEEIFIGTFELIITSGQ